MKFLRNFLLGCLLITSPLLMAGNIDINNANAGFMAKHLKGVGIKKAEAIVVYRNKHGKFKKLDDLLLVKGIGKKILLDNKINLVLGENKKP